MNELKEKQLFFHNIFLGRVNSDGFLSKHSRRCGHFNAFLMANWKTGQRYKHSLFNTTSCFITDALKLMSQNILCWN